MLKTALSRFTVHDYRELPEGPPFYHLIEGDLEKSPAPNRAHGDILLNIIDVLRAHLRKYPLGRIYVAPFDVYLTDLNVYQPDLIFVSNSRKRILTDQGAEGAPDLVVEILSPRTAKLDRGVKRHIYARTGVRELWLVDPDREHIELYDLPEDPNIPAATYSIRQKLTSRLLPKLSVPVSRIFQL